MESDERQSAKVLMNNAFAAHYRAVQYQFVQFFCEHLVDCSRTFGGDFDQVIILALLGQRALDAAKLEDQGDEAVNDALWMPAMRIADLTALPRETVRRKLKALEARGWAQQKTSKGWALVRYQGETSIKQSLGGLDTRGMIRLAKLVVEVNKIIEPTE